MKVLLVNPRGVIHDYPSVGLASIGAVLKKNGFDVKICEENYLGEDPIAAIDETNPDVVGISVLSANWYRAVEIGKYAKSLKKMVLFGGPHVSLFGELILKEADCIDYGIMGDGEFTALELLTRMENKKNTNGIPGVISRNEDNSSKKSVFITDLDYIPFPDYSLSGIKSLKKYPLLTSRGCPYGCIYCSVGNVSGKTWRANSPNRVINEIKHAKIKYGVISFHIVDDNFTLNTSRAKKICRKIIESGIKIRWECANGIRADGLDEELVKLMKISGCALIAFGIESGDPNIFGKINKSETLEIIERGILLSRKHGIKTQGFFITGLPGATFKSEMKSMGFAKKNHLDSAAWGQAIPFCGTKLREWVDKNAILLDKDVDHKHSPAFSIDSNPYYETHEFSREDRKKAFAIGNLRFGSYWLGRDSNKLRAGIRLVKIAWKYDKKNVPYYLFRIFITKIVKRTLNKVMTNLK